jgi:hypothetical protein
VDHTKADQQCPDYVLVEGIDGGADIHQIKGDFGK